MKMLIGTANLANKYRQRLLEIVKMKGHTENYKYCYFDNEYLVNKQLCTCFFLTEAFLLLVKSSENSVVYLFQEIRYA